MSASNAKACATANCVDKLLAGEEGCADAARHASPATLQSSSLLTAITQQNWTWHAVNSTTNMVQALIAMLSERAILCHFE